jgi:hypothetical protein
MQHRAEQMAHAFNTTSGKDYNYKAENSLATQDTFIYKS